MIDVITPNRARTVAFQGTMAMVLSVFFATLTFNIFGQKASFLFAPFIVLFLWPKGADAVLSYFGIFVCCLLLDILTGDPLGGWALIYLPFFVFMVFFNSGRETGFGETWLNFLFWMTAFTVFFVIAKFTRFLDVDLWSLAILATLNLLLFPIVYAFKVKMREVLVTEDTA